MLHSQILAPFMFRSVTPQWEKNNILKCHSNNFA